MGTVLPTTNTRSAHIPIDDDSETALVQPFIRRTDGTLVNLGALTGYTFTNYAGTSAPGTVNVDGLCFTISVVSEHNTASTLKINSGQTITIPKEHGFEWTVPVEYLETMRDAVITLSGGVKSYFIGVLQEPA